MARCPSTGGDCPLPLSPDVPVQVKMAFSEARALPGAALGLQLGAAPGSLCAVRAVDRSVLLLKPEAELNAEAVSADPAWGPHRAPGAGAGGGRTLPQVSLTWTQCCAGSQAEPRAPKMSILHIFIPRSTKHCPNSTTPRASRMTQTVTHTGGTTGWKPMRCSR